jgi:HAD superfamily hydrolase (TIGR01509 family)
MSEFDLVIFDCDGVLVDSEMLSGHVFIATLKEFDIALSERAFFEKMIGKSYESAVAAVAEETGKMPPPVFKERLRKALLERFEAELRPVDGIARLLSALTAKHCVATSSDPVRASRSLAIAGLDTFFGLDIFSATMVQNGKPAPDLFLYAAHACATAPERCVVIEDSGYGLIAAKKAGMTAWHFTGASHFKSGYRVAETIERDASYASMKDLLEAFRGRGMA